jgi:hypothetical protein
METLFNSLAAASGEIGVIFSSLKRRVKPETCMNEELVLAEFGTFDVENYGDLVYPILLERMVRQRQKALNISKFSLMGSNSLQNSGYDSQPIQSLFSSSGAKPHTLIVGGGDLLRTDWNTVAGHYRSICREQRQMLLGSKLRRLLGMRQREPADPDGDFRRRHMNYAAVGPFIIEPVGASMIGSVVYCSCGVPFPFDEKIKNSVAATLKKSIFIYVRDHVSAKALQQAGVTREIHAAPDLIVALSDFFDAAAERDKGRRILQQHGVDLQRRVLCVQSYPQPPEANAALVSQLTTYQKRTGCEVVLLPLGWCHGDREYLQQVAQESRCAFKYVELNSIFDMMAALAACDVFMGTSLHGNITAFSFGIPHLFGPIQVAKREGFLEIANLPPDLKLDSWSEANQKLDVATGLGAGFFATRARAARRRVHEVFDLLFRAVTPAAPRSNA